MHHMTAPDNWTALWKQLRYHTGRGRVVMRGKVDIEPIPNKPNRERLIITEIPYQVNKARLVQQIAGLVQGGKITGISDLRDESNRLGMRVVVDLKRDPSL